MSKDDKDYKVGRGKPPAGTRFKKGQSGNPGGRPKKEPGVYNVDQLRKLLLKEGNQPLKIVQDGEPVEIPVIQGIFKTLHKKALQGDIKAIKFTIEQHLILREADDAARVKLMETLHALEDIYKEKVEVFQYNDSAMEPCEITILHDVIDEIRARINDGLDED